MEGTEEKDIQVAHDSALVGFADQGDEEYSLVITSRDRKVDAQGGIYVTVVDLGFEVQNDFECIFAQRVGTKVEVVVRPKATEEQKKNDNRPFSYTDFAQVNEELPTAVSCEAKRYLKWYENGRAVLLEGKSTRLHDQHGETVLDFNNGERRAFSYPVCAQAFGDRV